MPPCARDSTGARAGRSGGRETGAPPAAGYTRAMKTSLALAAAVLAAAAPVLAESRPPVDWDQRASGSVGDAARASRVAAAARLFDEQLLASRAAMKRAELELRETFTSPASSAADRRLALNLFRDDRRKAAVSAVDAMLKVRALVSEKEWKALWPDGYFVAEKPAPRLAERLPEALAAVVTDPARLGQAQAVAADLVKATKADVSAGKKARGRLEGLFSDYDTYRDNFIDLVNRLNDEQEKHDEAAIEASGKLRQVLTPEEWDALTRWLAPGE